jgi:hypothetical protein
MIENLNEALVWHFGKPCATISEDVIVDWHIPEPQPTLEEIPAIVDAYKTYRIVEIANVAILEQITIKETDAIRSLRELIREQHFPGDLTPQAKAFAQNRVRVNGKSSYSEPFP